MQKLKSLKLFSLVKAGLLGIVITLIGMVLFAVVLKFTNLDTKTISYINDVIKAVSIFFVVLLVKRLNGRLLINGAISGLIYGLLCFLVFSILNGGFEFNLSFVWDLLFAVLVGIIASVIVNVMSRKNA
ncbi:MAG: TIGR04086 family membrane protein [Clostridiales bacterium]|nr:TIGR04086 family membrane protein [Clostridiales bacterium]